MLDRYDANEFETVAYFATSGGLGTPDSDARQVYYGSNGLPHLLFNGTTLVVGAGTDAINGSAYDPIVRSMLDDPTPMRMKIVSYSWSPGTVTVRISLEQDLPDISQTKVRIALVENNCLSGSTRYNNVVRDLLTDVSLTISQSGQSQEVTMPFTVGGGWNTANMRIAAFVQNDANKHIYQSCTSRPVPSYSMRYYAMGEPAVVGAGAHTFGTCALFNAGTLGDEYTVSLDASALPSGWSASFNHEGSDHSSLELTLTPEERALFAVKIVPGGIGQGNVTLTFHSKSGQVDDRQIRYSLITAGVRILVVDDDGAFDYETHYYAPALDPLGHPYAIWDRSAASLSGPVLENFNVVVWECGFSFPTVDEADRAALAAYLDGGGNLFITGQDIGWEMDDIGGPALDWYHNYLHATYMSDDTNDLTLTGVPGDPIGDGVSLNIGGGDGANNQEYPSDIDPLGPAASTVFVYDASRNGGIKADTGTHRVVYFAFGYEAINDQSTRALVMARVIDWLMPEGVGVPDGSAPAPIMALGNVPNPFNPKTDIVFSLGAKTPVELTIYDVAGRRVRRLESGPLEAGEHRLAWDGCDGAGRSAPAGTYFYRVCAAGTTRTGKMSLVR